VSAANPNIQTSTSRPVIEAVPFIVRLFLLGFIAFTPTDGLWVEEEIRYHKIIIIYPHRPSELLFAAAQAVYTTYNLLLHRIRATHYCARTVFSIFLA